MPESMDDLNDSYGPKKSFDVELNRLKHNRHDHKHQHINNKHRDHNRSNNHQFDQSTLNKRHANNSFPNFNNISSSSNNNQDENDETFNLASLLVKNEMKLFRIECMQHNKDLVMYEYINKVIINNY